MNNTQRFRTLLVPAVACLAMAAPTESAADIFLKFGDIKGEVTQKDYKEQIEILSWSFGLSRGSAGAISGAGRSGKLCASDISIMKSFDKSSPGFMTNMVTGKNTPTAKLSFTRNVGDGAPQEYLSIELTNVQISSYQVSGNNEERPIDSVSLHFQAAKVSYKPQKADGSLDAAIVSNIMGDGC
jgi:type VI secretion system secreted protein Hcp